MHTPDEASRGANPTLQTPRRPSAGISARSGCRAEPQRHAVVDGEFFTGRDIAQGADADLVFAIVVIEGDVLRVGMVIEAEIDQTDGAFLAFLEAGDVFAPGETVVVEAG